MAQNVAHLSPSNEDKCLWASCTTLFTVKSLAFLSIECQLLQSLKTDWKIITMADDWLRRPVHQIPPASRTVRILQASNTFSTL